MTMLKQTEGQWTKGEYLNFRDDGKISKIGKTRVFVVLSRTDNTFLGYVKWFGQLRKYCYWTVDCILEARCLREIAEFCELKTTEQKADWKPNLPPSKKGYDGRRTYAKN